MPLGIQAALAAALSAALLLLGGCVAVTQPVASGAEDVPDLAPYVGWWRVDAVGQDVQMADTYLELSLAGPSTLHGTIRQRSTAGPGSTIDLEIQPTNVSGATVVSVQANYPHSGPLPSWQIGTVALSDDAASMTVSSLKPELLRDAVESGELPGKLPGYDVESAAEFTNAINVDGAALRAFLVDHPEAFESDELSAVTLVRSTEPELGDQEYLEQGQGVEQRYVPSAPTTRQQAAQGYPYGDSYDPSVPYPAPWPTAQVAPAPMSGVTLTPMGADPNQWVGRESAADSARSALLDNLLLAMFAVLLVGLVAALALGYVGQRSRRTTAPEDAANGVDGEPPAGMEATAGYRRYLWPAVAIGAIAVGPIVCLATFLLGLSTPTQLGAQPGAQALLYGFSPLLLAFSLGALIGSAEILATFPTVSVEALGTKWSISLVLLNALATAAVYSAAVAGLAHASHPVLWGLAIATSFIVLLRTRFVLARDLRGETGGEGVSLDVGWLYGHVQQAWHQRIEAELLSNPRYATEQLLARCPDAASLEVAARYTAQSPSAPPDLQDRLTAARAADVSPGLQRAHVARLIAESLDPAALRFLFDHLDSGASPR